MSESGRPFDLEVFHNTCFDCGHQFETLVDTQAYGWVLYVSEKGELRFIDAFSDPVWEEAKALMAEVIGRKRGDVEGAALFHQLLPLTFDPPSPGDIIRYYEQEPCPKCRSIRRRSVGPCNPGRRRTVTIAPVTHECWSQLSIDERRDTFRQHLHERAAAMAASLPAYMAATRTALGHARELRARLSAPPPPLKTLEAILEKSLEDAQATGEVPALRLIVWVSGWLPPGHEPLIDALEAIERVTNDRIRGS